MPWIPGCRRRWSRASRAARALRSASPTCSPGIRRSPRPRSPRLTTCRTDAPCWASAPATAAPGMSACRGRARATLGGASAHLPWIKRAPPVFLAASHPQPLQAAGRTADGVFANYGLAADNIRDSRTHIAAGAKAAGRAGYVIGDKHLETRGVPEPLRAPLLELRRRYSTRPGEADIRLVQELGLFDYLSQRLSICGNPQDCLAQALAAEAAGAERLMLTVSLACDPVRTVELFGEHVLAKL